MANSQPPIDSSTIVSQKRRLQSDAPAARQTPIRLDNSPVGDAKVNAAANDLDVLARWMDSAFGIPGIPIRFGLDSLMGLLPGVGDIATSLVALHVLNVAHKQGVPRITLARMTANIAIDTCLGAVPFLGDIFDVFWKSNQRNVRLLRRHLAASHNEARRLTIADRLFVAALACLVIALTIGSLMLGFMAAKWVISAAQGWSNPPSI